MNNKLEFSEIYMTPGIDGLVPPNIVFSYLQLHQYGYYGNICKEDWELNERSIKNGARVMSEYLVGKDKIKIWIISDGVNDPAEPRRTTILLPEEY